MLEKLIRGAFYCVLCAAVTGFVGCASSVDEVRIEEIENEMIELDDKITEMIITIQELSDDVLDFDFWIKDGNKGGAPSAETTKLITQLESRTASLEKKLNDANSKIAKLTTGLKSAQKKLGSYNTPNYSSPAPQTTTATTASPPKIEQPVTVGYHYSVAEGETVDSIAQKTGVSASKIRNANNPLAGAREPMPNTLIWIPGSRKN